MFRKLYAQFLDEAREYAALPKTLVNDMFEIAECWTQLAAVLKRASEDESAAWIESGQIAQEVARLERRFHEQTIEL